VRDRLLSRHREPNQTAWSPAVRSRLSRHGLDPAAIPRRRARLTRRDVEAYLAARPATGQALAGPAARPAEPPAVCTTTVDVTGLAAGDLPAAIVAALVEISRGNELIRAALAPPARLLVEQVGSGRRQVITGAGDLNVAGLRRQLARPRPAGPAADPPAGLHVLISDAPRVLPSPANSPAPIALALTPGAPAVEAVPDGSGGVQLAIRSVADLAIAVRPGAPGAASSAALSCAAALRDLFDRPTWKDTLA
jgi:hypothetical protein